MADGLSFGLFGLHRGENTNPETLTRRAQLAEAAGFESVWVGDHISLPMGAAGGRGVPARTASAGGDLDAQFPGRDHQPGPTWRRA